MKISDLKDITKDDVLAALGLSLRPSTTSVVLGTIGTFGLGVLVGAGAALLLAPKAGRELRQDLRTRIGNATDRLSEEGESLEERIS